MSDTRLTVVASSSGPGKPRNHELRVALSTAWEAAVVAGRLMVVLAERMDDARARGRLMVMAAFCRAHAARLATCVRNMGRGPMPAEPVDTPVRIFNLHYTFTEAARFADAMSKRYEQMAALSRSHGNLSAAWVCDLNRTEEADRARELLAVRPPK